MLLDASTGKARSCFPFHGEWLADFNGVFAPQAGIEVVEVVEVVGWLGWFVVGKGFVETVLATALHVGSADAAAPDNGTA